MLASLRNLALALTMKMAYKKNILYPDRSKCCPVGYGTIRVGFGAK